MAWWLVCHPECGLEPPPPPLLPQSNFARPPPAPAAALLAAAGSLFDVLAHFHPPANRICSNILMKHTTCLTDILDSDQTFEETSSQTLVSHSDKLYLLLPSAKRTHSNLYSVGSWHFLKCLFDCIFDEMRHQSFLFTVTLESAWVRCIGKTLKKFLGS